MARKDTSVYPENPEMIRQQIIRPQAVFFVAAPAVNSGHPVCACCAAETEASIVHHAPEGAEVSTKAPPTCVRMDRRPTSTTKLMEETVAATLSSCVLG